MTHQDSLAPRLRRIMAGVLDVDPLAIGEDTTPEDIPSWDSMGHMMIITAVEGEFDVHFSMSEVWTVLSFDALLRAVESKR